MLALSSPAQAQTAPTLAISEAHAFRNIVQTGDLFILVRYELPISVTGGMSDAWCAYLEDQTGCDASPALPEAPDTLLDQTASVTFYTDCIGTNCSAAVGREYADQLPRIDHALAGVYFAAGHELTWNTATYGVCIESNAVTFATNEQECLNPQWNAASSDTASQRAELEEQIVVTLRTLETTRNDPELSIVNGSNLITENGRVFALEALGVMAVIIPDVFQAASRVVATPFATASSGSSLQAQLDSDNAEFVSDWNTIGLQYFGQPGRNVTFTITLIIGFLIAGLVGVLQSNYTPAERSAVAAGGGVAFVLVLAIGALMSAVPIDGFFGWIFIGALPMAWWIVGKVRGG